ncbi:DNA-binding LytR/AlgR family response regulator [Desulfohalotomaculum tongense]|uniref:LytR/AlgR family response regulator transcription factor n=1 Tax=Desulforadius tongensis TaxID=1216062 RepID=UPI00195B08F8|nr:LytTR family DNA-binding domain-containing protein [Desulforadius tongensis]MBM7854990.1 DNA-binding LytR/AlgR family response regulator [Desulforadius tongensis]
MLEKIDAVIVDDNPYSAKVFSNMLIKSGRINVAGIFDSGEKLMVSFQSGLNCHIVFWDTALPGIAGSKLEEYLRKERSDIQVVFVTANIEFTPEAFDLEATDYLVKPFDEERLNRCITRILNKIESSNRKAETYTIENKSDTIILNIDHIIFIEKYKKNSIFHTTEGIYKSYESLNTVEKKLNCQDFFRSHRSFIVNKNYIQRVKRWGDRAYEIIFTQTDKTASLSRSRIGMLKSLIKREG